jgi:hypothetical protein
VGLAELPFNIPVEIASVISCHSMS